MSIRGTLIDWAPDPSGDPCGIAWVTLLGQRVGFTVYYDPETDAFDLGSDIVFADPKGRERFRRWLIDEITMHSPALEKPEANQ